MTEDGCVVTDDMMTEAEANEYKACYWMYKKDYDERDFEHCESCNCGKIEETRE